MKIKNILLTSDDGHDSLGIRLLIHLLKNKYKLCVAGTKEQQSGKGGACNIMGGEWGETLIDGVPTIWVDGSPCDAVEAAASLHQEQFDLVISGVNLGVNFGGLMINSGTFSAAFKALDLKISKKALALSWNVPADFWLRSEEEKNDLFLYLPVLGEMIKKTLDLIFANNLWQADLLNINFPSNKTNQVAFTQPAFSKDHYPLITVDREVRKFSYPLEINSDKKDKDITLDMEAVNRGLISIMPCQTNFLDKEKYEKLKDLKIKLK